MSVQNNNKIIILYDSLSIIFKIFFFFTVCSNTEFLLKLDFVNCYPNCKINF